MLSESMASFSTLFTFLNLTERNRLPKRLTPLRIKTMDNSW